MFLILPRNMRDHQEKGVKLTKKKSLPKGGIEEYKSGEAGKDRAGKPRTKGLTIFFRTRKNQFGHPFETKTRSDHGKIW